MICYCIHVDNYFATFFPKRTIRSCRIFLLFSIYTIRSVLNAGEPNKKFKFNIVAINTTTALSLIPFHIDCITVNMFLTQRKYNAQCYHRAIEVWFNNMHRLFKDMYYIFPQQVLASRSFHRRINKQYVCLAVSIL